ncbi:hypothetical protein JIG36_03765 [Actinoplanes sp. LDG1-06]|uniref:Uncharacterized protein n=1 Tax=Paractinoplanes ovalisporus TaxID=2810368 RepID=A0ABS2A492_9ACTN|nr:hypothetical protein [Actinoplanes ovalisporus]MBM2614671.1 hypothetical protein [Actinoplanes ovalisporus]
MQFFDRILFARYCHTRRVTNEIVFALALGLIAGASGIVANWVPRPAWFKPSAALPVLGILVAGSAFIAYYAGHADNPGTVTITRPAQNAQVPQRNILEGVVQRNLQKNHTLWFDVHANDEQLHHFAEKECSVINEALSCPEAVVGDVTERSGKLFVVTLYDCDVEAATKLSGPAYAGRAKTGDKSDYAGQPRPTGCNPVDSVVVART